MSSRNHTAIASHTSPPALAAGFAQTSGDRQPNMFSRLDPAELSRVMACGSMRRLPRGRTLFAQGDQHDGVFLIESGLIRTFYTSPGGREITLAYWEPGNIVGTPQVLGTGKHMWSGIAARDSTAFGFSGDRLRELMHEVPALAIGVVEALEFKGKCLSSLLQMLGTRSVSERLTMLLANLAEIHGVESHDGIAIGEPFTHEAFAQMVGASRQWVTMTLDRFQRDGLIRIGRCRTVIFSVDELRASQKKGRRKQRAKTGRRTPACMVGLADPL